MKNYCTLDSIGKGFSKQEAILLNMLIWYKLILKADGTLVWCWKLNWKIKHQVIIFWTNVVWIEKIECESPT